MGAWGNNTFENDTACDWGYTLEEAADLAPVEAAIAAVLDADGRYIDADAASEALAACEVIARLKGNWGVRDSYTESIDRWVESHPITPGPTLTERANSGDFSQLATLHTPAQWMISCGRRRPNNARTASPSLRWSPS